MSSADHSICSIGVVTSTKRWSDTHIRSYGGGGYVGSGGGYVSAPQVTSNVVQRLEISVRDSHGKESFEDVSGYGVRFKDGDGIAFLKETASENFVYLENTTTGEAYSFKFASRPGSAFKGFLIGMMSAIVAALMVSFGGYGVARALVNEPPDYSAAAAEAEKNACIQGKTYGAPSDWSASKLTFVDAPCRDGWVADKPVGPKKLATCRCVDREKDKQYYFNIYQKRAQEDAEARNVRKIGGVLFFILGAATLAGFLSWIVVGRIASQSGRKQKEQTRKDYWDGLRAIAFAGGLPLTSIDPINGPLKK